MITLENFLKRKIFKDFDEKTITDRHKNEIQKILEIYDTEKKIKNRQKNIYDFIKYDVSGTWLERINIIVNVLKNVTTTDYALEIRYGKENVEELKKKFYAKLNCSLEGHINRHGEVEGTKRYKAYVKKCGIWGLDACIKKYGEIDGPKKWNERLTKKINTQNERKKIQPYRNGRTLLEYQNRYGTEDGYNRWLKRNKNQSYRFSEKYYIDTYGENEGSKLWYKYKQQMSKTSLQSFIDRYGDENGKHRYTIFTDKLSESNSEIYNIKKYGDELGKKRYRDIIISRTKASPHRYSKISQELFWNIYDKVKNNENCYFGELNSEYIFFVWEEWASIISVDFKYKNKIIEFDGDFWHSSEKQKSLDILRDSYLVNKNYKILRIKESDYKNNKLNILNKCLVFLNEENE